MAANDTVQTALAICDMLGIDPDKIRNTNGASLYVDYRIADKVYELRFSDHPANPVREDLKTHYGVIPVDCGNDTDAAMRRVKRVILGEWCLIPVGSVVNHPVYGAGEVEHHDRTINTLDVRFSDFSKTLVASLIVDRGGVTSK